MTQHALPAQAMHAQGFMPQRGQLQLLIMLSPFFIFMSGLGCAGAVCAQLYIQ
jgi:hypothetical protein